MKILVRLPNWLGDMVMAAGAMQQLPHFFPGARVSVVVKKGLQDLLPFFPPVEHSFVFSKAENKGLKGLWRFGKMISQTERFDLFVSFPDSFSAALMGYATGAPHRTGYKKEGRELLLTESFTKPEGLHRVEEYVRLLEWYSGIERKPVQVCLHHSFARMDTVVININSEAESRRLPVAKAAEVIEQARASFSERILLIGGPTEKAYVQSVLDRLPSQQGIESVAGKTTLAGLAQILASARVVLTTDSGPAHLANALGTQTVVLFGAGNENNTAPYNQNAVEVIRLGQLSCEPCTKNVCLRFGTPQCLTLLDTPAMLASTKNRITYD